MYVHHPHREGVEKGFSHYPHKAGEYHEFDTPAPEFIGYPDEKLVLGSGVLGVDEQVRDFVFFRPLNGESRGVVHYQHLHRNPKGACLDGIYNGLEIGPPSGCKNAEL